MVWKEKLLMTMIDRGIPMQMIRWLNSFLQNRQARVRVNGELGQTFPMRQGLPQGAVLSPILFLFYINTLAEILPAETINCLFADDVSALAVENTLEEAQESCQKTVNVVVEWAKEWKLMLNAGKSEVSYFSNSTKETPKTFTPTIVINGKAIAYKEQPRLLGVILDRQLCFRPHIEKIQEKTDSKVKMLMALSNTDWGCRKEHLMKVYNSHYDSVINFGGFAWKSSLRPSNVEALDTIKRRALRIVTGQFARCPNNAPFLEVGCPSTATEIKREAVKAAEKCLRLPADHPRRIAFEQAAPKRLMKNNWAITAKNIMSNLPISRAKREPLDYFATAPWVTYQDISINVNLEGIASKNEDEARKIQAAYRAIEVVHPRHTIYTDGSASGGLTLGGSAAILTTGPPEDPIAVMSKLVKGAEYTSSYGEERTAMEAAADMIVEQNLQGPILICTDSQSLCKALAERNKQTDTIRKRFSECEQDITIQWIPGHSNIPGNELADQAAKEATMLDEEHRPTSFGSACAAIKQQIKEENLSGHERTAKAYAYFSKLREKQIKTRKEQVTLARIRSGHHKAFQEIHHRLDATVDPMCPKCEEDEHTLEHWMLHCDATMEAKQKLFGDDQKLGLGLLTKNPRDALTLARRTLLEDSTGRPPPQDL
jgi:ribonuclease HI